MLARPQYMSVCLFLHWTATVAATVPASPLHFVFCLDCTVEACIVFLCRFHFPVAVCVGLLRDLRAFQARRSIPAYMGCCFRAPGIWVACTVLWGYKQNACVTTHSPSMQSCPPPITSSHSQKTASTKREHPLSKFQHVHADRQKTRFFSWLKNFI